MAVFDRAAHRRDDKHWLADAWPNSLVLVVDVRAGGRARVHADGRLALVPAASAPPAERVFLGCTADGTAVFAVDAPLGDGAESLRDAGDRLPPWDTELLSTASALLHWHAANPFCARTGRPATAAHGGWLRVGPDNAPTWPRTDPAVIVLVHDGVPGPQGRCLLASNVGWRGAAGHRQYSCLAGFIEPGESAEAAVHREVGEEVGVALSQDLRYVASQPWPFPGSLMLGFTATADPSRQLRIAADEIAAARWFSREQVVRAAVGECRAEPGGDVVVLPPASSLARRLIAGWLAADRRDRS